MMVSTSPRDRALAILAAVLLCAWPVRAISGTAAGSSAAVTDDFFIVSSVDVAQKRLVLKRPSEVTVLVRVTEKTSYRSEQNRPLQLGDLRAGDTVFIRLGTGTESDLAKSVRRGPMTVEELHRRYFRAGNSAR
jgi:hypothetical protein